MWTLQMQKEKCTAKVWGKKDTQSTSLDEELVEKFSWVE